MNVYVASQRKNPFCCQAGVSSVSTDTEGVTMLEVQRLAVHLLSTVRALNGQLEILSLVINLDRTVSQESNLVVVLLALGKFLSNGSAAHSIVTTEAIKLNVLIKGEEDEFVFSSVSVSIVVHLGSTLTNVKVGLHGIP